MYLTTYYSEYNRPIFRLVCSYMLWKARHAGTLNIRPLTGDDRSLPLGTAEGRESVVKAVAKAAEREHLSARQKDEVAARLAALVGVDYQELRAKRILQLSDGHAVHPQDAELGERGFATLVDRERLAQLALTQKMQRDSVAWPHASLHSAPGGGLHAFLRTERDGKGHQHTDTNQQTH